MIARSSIFIALLLTAACGAPPPLDDDGAPTLGAPGEGVWRTAAVRIDDRIATLSVEDFDGTYVLDGDIVLDPEDVTVLDDHDALDAGGVQATPPPTEEQGLAAVKRGRLWPGGVVYYRFSASLSSTMRHRVKRAMAAWEDRASIVFEKAGPGRDDYVLIKPFQHPYCRASIGHGSGVRYMWLSHVCSVGLIKHELGHSLGLYHEQSRQDRDKHVRILWNNVERWARGNFDRYRETAGRDVGPYDLDSIMQYSSYAFSKNGAPTIVRVSDGRPFGGYRTAISDLDARYVKRIYAHAAQ